jgi:broad specificity phosphatase PhoE
MAPEIIECRWGDYEGLPFADPRIVEAFVKVRTDRNYAPQGGESHGRVMQRIGNYAFPIIASAKGGKLAFCSSIGAFRSLFIRYFNLEYTSGFSIGVPNCCVYRLLPNRPRNPELALEYLTAKNGRWMPGFCPADEHSPISNGR